MESQIVDYKNPVSSRDFACGDINMLIWIVPAIIVGITANLSSPYIIIVYPVLVTFMGGACLLNAKRCGRLHCFITGPFFLLLAGLSLLYGLGLVPFGHHGWRWLVNALFIGGCVLTCVPEALFGKYVRRSKDA
ncbi:MAG: hypothetical protein ACRER0_03845 [Gammaproteobacteria bacterium]